MRAFDSLAVNGTLVDSIFMVPVGAFDVMGASASAREGSAAMNLLRPSGTAGTRRRRARAWIALMVAMAGAEGAEALSHFDPAWGRVIMDGAGVHFSFDRPPSLQDPELLLWDTRRQATPASERASLGLGREQAIEGDGALRLGGRSSSTIWILLERATNTLAGRRVEATFWQRPEGTKFRGEIEWYFGDTGAAIKSGDLSGLRSASSLAFQPTGRITDDGFEEWSTGPFDYALGAHVAPLDVRLYDSNSEGGAPSSAGGRVSDTGRVILDALELHDLGPALYSEFGAGACNGASESVCGEAGACLFGRCVDASLLLAGLPINPEYQRDMLARRSFEFSNFDGSREATRQSGLFRFGAAVLMQSRNPKALWLGLRDLVEKLHDGHASTPFFAQAWLQPSGGACTVLGEADLEPGDPSPHLLPIVLEEDNTSMAAGLYRRGDLIFQIDGLPTSDWQVEMAPWLRSNSGDEAKQVIESEQLLSLAALKGSLVTIHRCLDQSVQLGRCQLLETPSVDYAALAERDLWSGKTEGWDAKRDLCDGRITRAGPTDQPGSFELFQVADLKGSATQPGVRQIVFNGFPNDGLFQDAFMQALSDAPARVILDARLGYGGYSNSLALVAAMLLAPGDHYGTLGVPAVTPLPNEADFALEACAQSTADPVVSVCGGADNWTFHANPRGLAEIVASSRVALLINQDVSANDYIAQYVSMREAASEIFGPTSSYGAFGWIADTPRTDFDWTGGSLQVTDSAFMKLPTDDPVAFRTGQGVTPSIRIYQKQSDALMGIDTTLEAALRWVEQ